MNDEFVELKDYPGYLINRHGQVVGVRGDILSPDIRGNYQSVVLCKDKKHIKESVHRLVALTFLPNPENYPWVDHKNKDKLDNRLENLRWVPPWLNQHNREASINSTSGVKGVFWNKTKNTYRASLMCQGKVYQRHFKTIEEAQNYLSKLRKSLGLD